MVPPLALDPKPGERVLDLTAAPGSKTSQIAALMNNQGLLMANDNSRERFFRLKRNLEQLGVANSSLDLQLKLEHGSKIGRQYHSYFDKVLLDAPCSSEARFIAGNEKSFGYWKEKKLSEIAKRQRPLLMAAINALRPGGTLVYSTCTLSPEENEMQIDWLLKKTGAEHKKGGDESDYCGDEISNEARLELVEIGSPLNTIKRLPPVTNWRDKVLSNQISKTLHILPTEEMEGFFVATIKKY
jgi:16S rRNA (cytosine1407-C5)-methyltransferase